MAPTDYARPGPLTVLSARHFAAAAGLPRTPIDLCAVVPGLVVHPLDTDGLDLSRERMSTQSLRPVSAIVDALLTIDGADLDVPRGRGDRVVGTCRTFVVLACALLRWRGIPARARCGFGSYFQPGLHLDHWIAEYWEPEQARWVRVDVEHLHATYVPRPDDLAPDEFRTGGEAWQWYRAGGVDGMTFGVAGTSDAWGPAEIRGNAIRDLAALNRVELLPWDNWGRMQDSYDGKTGADYDTLIDRVAAACADPSPSAARDLYRMPELTVPPGLLTTTGSA
ncbi:MAG TPA: transglutaminase-like domain-containing protein [Actinomycetes bacterium]|nr:transglutaminase-like domain-containing protein [Actinomycetes bacterium]